MRSQFENFDFLQDCQRSSFKTTLCGIFNLKTYSSGLTGSGFIDGYGIFG